MKRLSRLLTFSAVMVLVASRFAIGQREIVLYTFGTNPNDATYPFAGVIFDSAGNLYGTTSAGGDKGCGTVFKLAPPSSGGSWTETIIHSFCAEPGDGASPQEALVFDSAGNLYGSAEGGGAYGEGTVFQLVPNSDGSWTENTLYSFMGGNDGRAPGFTPALDGLGNLYGTTGSGGDLSCDSPYGCGTVFELTPPKSPGESWTKTTLLMFNQIGGAVPTGPLIFAAGGNLYGTTEAGGAGPTCGGNGGIGCGTVFELSPASGGGWTETVLTTFQNFFNQPKAGVVFDPAGNLYGTVNNSGVFKLTKSNGVWTQTDHIIQGNLFGGVYINAKQHTLYATTSDGGSYSQGSVFAIKGSTVATFSFCHFKNCPSGSDLASTLVPDAQGNLYGTAAEGGTNDVGVVFEMVP